MNALWIRIIKRLYFCPFSCPKIGKLFNDSHLSVSRQTKGTTSSESSAFARHGVPGGRIEEKPPERRAQARTRSRSPVFALSATKMQETRNKMPVASVYLLQNPHFLPIFVADSVRKWVTLGFPRSLVLKARRGATWCVNQESIIYLSPEFWMTLVHLGFILDTIRDKGYDTRITSSRHLDDSYIVMS